MMIVRRRGGVCFGKICNILPVVAGRVLSVGCVYNLSYILVDAIPTLKSIEIV